MTMEICRLRETWNNHSDNHPSHPGLMRCSQRSSLYQLQLEYFRLGFLAMELRLGLFSWGSVPMICNFRVWDSDLQLSFQLRLGAVVWACEPGI